MGNLDVKRSSGCSGIHICSGRLCRLLMFCNIFVVWYDFFRSRGATLESMGNHSVWVDLIVSKMMSTVLFNWAPTFLQWALLAHADAQYSSTLYTRESVVVQLSWLHPQQVSANLAITLLRVFSLLFMPSNCWLYAKILSNFTPRYLS